MFSFSRSVQAHQVSMNLFARCVLDGESTGKSFPMAIRFDQIAPAVIVGEAALEEEEYVLLRRFKESGRRGSLHLQCQNSIPDFFSNVLARVVDYSLVSMRSGSVMPVAQFRMDEIRLGQPVDANLEPGSGAVARIAYQFAMPFWIDADELRDVHLSFGEVCGLSEDESEQCGRFRLLVGNSIRVSPGVCGGHQGRHAAKVGVLVLETPFEKGRWDQIVADADLLATRFCRIAGLLLRHRLDWVERSAGIEKEGVSGTAGCHYEKVIQAVQMPTGQFPRFPLARSSDLLPRVAATSIGAVAGLADASSHAWLRSVEFLSESWHSVSDEARLASVFLGLETFKAAFAKSHDREYWVPSSELERSRKAFREGFRQVVSAELGEKVGRAFPAGKEMDVLRTPLVELIVDMAQFFGVHHSDIFPELGKQKPRAFKARDSLFHTGQLLPELASSTGEFKDEVCRLSCLLERLLLGVLSRELVSETRAAPGVCFDPDEYLGRPQRTSVVLGLDIDA